MKEESESEYAITTVDKRWAERRLFVITMAGKWNMPCYCGGRDAIPSLT